MDLTIPYTFYPVALPHWIAGVSGGVAALVVTMVVSMVITFFVDDIWSPGTVMTCISPHEKTICIRGRPESVLAPFSESKPMVWLLSKTRRHIVRQQA